MLNLNQILTYLKEAKSVGPAFLVTGAFGPYTSAHEEMARAAAEHAAKTGHTHFYHGIGASQLKMDSPLSHEEKTKIVSGSHKHIAANMSKEHKGKLTFGIVPKQDSITPFHQIAHLISKGHKDITVALGSDQLAPGGVKEKIVQHLEKHGGFVGTDKKVHDVNINFHQLGAPRNEGEIDREKLLGQIGKGDLSSVKAGRLRKAIASGDEELAHAMMPASVTDKKGYFNLIKGRMDEIQRGIDAKRTEKEAKKAAAAKKKPKTKSKKKVSKNNTVKESVQKILTFLEAAKDPTRMERDHRMYGWGSSKPTAKQLANRKRKNSRDAARDEAIADGRVAKGGGDIDHKNGNPLDNSKDNIRVMSRSANRSRNNNKRRK